MWEKYSQYLIFRYISYQYRWFGGSWSSFDTSSTSGCSDEMSILRLHSMIHTFQETDSTGPTQTFGSRKRFSGISIIWVSTVAPLERSWTGCWWCDWFHTCITHLSGWTSGSGTHFTSWSSWSVIKMKKKFWSKMSTATARIIFPYK